MKTALAKHFLSLLCLVLFHFGAESQVNGIDQVRYLNPVFEKVEIQKDIVFGEAINSEGKSEQLLLDVYTPAGDKLKGRPVIVWIHGGGFKPGNDKSQGYIVKLAIEFAKRGYVCLSINYRIRNNPNDDKSGTITDAMTDAMSGLTWLRGNAGKLNIDTNKIIVGGGSAGGRVAVNLCYKDNSEKQRWDKSGIIGLVDLWGSPDESWQVSIVDKNDPPTIIIHGTEDKLVFFDISKRLDEELTRNKVEHELIPIVGEGHTPTKDMDKLVENISRFLYNLLTNQ
jgi:acetyl esterase/lipase